MEYRLTDLTKGKNRKVLGFDDLFKYITCLDISGVSPSAPSTPLKKEWEDEKIVKFSLPVPGVSKENISIETEDDCLYKISTKDVFNKIKEYSLSFKNYTSRGYKFAQVEFVNGLLIFTFTTPSEYGSVKKINILSREEERDLLLD
jgi:HSP20 family molecular chaperone IbpA